MPGNGGSAGPAERAKMEAFRKVGRRPAHPSYTTWAILQTYPAHMSDSQIKPTCVSLMSIAASSPTSYSAHAGLIDTLNNILSSVPSEALTTSMINYVLFPITQILRHHDPLSLPDIFLESTFRLLSLVVTAWKRHEGGMEIGAWEQLWRFTTASIAPRVVNAGKGKGKETGQEVQLQAVMLLTALLEPTSSKHPSDRMLERVASPKSPLMPTLFQTITLLLALVSPSSPRNDLQLAALSLLRPLVTTYLKGKHSVLAAVLPGTISSISKLFAGDGNSLKGDVASRSAGLAEAIIIGTLSDEGLRQLGVLQSGLDDLAQMVDNWEGSTIPPSPSPSDTTASGKDPFPPLSRSYLEFTASQLLVTLRPILSILSSHTSHMARHAASSLSFALMSRCHQSLPEILPFGLSTLLLLTQDGFDPVRDTARSHLDRLLVESAETGLDAALVDLLSEAVNLLPRLIMSHQEQKVINAARLLTALAETTSKSVDRNPIKDLLGPRGRIERWGWALLDCLEFGRPAGWSTMGTSAAQSAEKGWTGLLGSNLPLLLEGKAGDMGTFPELPLRYIDSEATIKIVRRALVSLGTAGGEPALHAVEYFVLLAKANRGREPSKAVSALWVAQLLLDGIAKGQEDGSEGRVGKATRKMARDVTRIIISMDEMEDEDEEEEVRPVEREEDSLVAVERSKGLDTITTLLDRPLRTDTHGARETKRLHAQAQRVLLTTLSLSTLSLTSRILSSSFRPLLLTVLYTVLSHLASPHHLVTTYAETTLNHIAYNTGYASVQNLILDNVDYVINVVSQRLTPVRLSPSAPLVLIAMIRLTRSEIVPMVHDIVDEIFDALDDYHGYEVLASGLLAVLVTLVDVMSDDVASQGVTVERSAKLKELHRLGTPPDPEADFARFTSWWEDRQKRRAEEVETILERAPQHAWGKAKLDDEEKPEDAPNDDAEPLPTRSQEITTSILDKSLNFLSHRSPFLRARILSLISRAVPVLAAGNREGDLLPQIDRAWGIILLRLDDPVPYVVTEAAEVVAALCKYVGDFMSRRIVDSAWPKLKKILSDQQHRDANSALARKGAVGTTSQWTVSHRLYLALVGIATYVAKEVPVDDGVLWDMMVLFRICIDRRAHEEIQEKAMDLYAALKRRDGDALWIVLTSTVGGGKSVWSHLRDNQLNVDFNAGKLLREI